MPISFQEDGEDTTGVGLNQRLVQLHVHGASFDAQSVSESQTQAVVHRQRRNREDLTHQDVTAVNVSAYDYDEASEIGPDHSPVAVRSPQGIGRHDEEDSGERIV